MNWQDERRVLDAEALRARPAKTRQYPVRIPHADVPDTVIVVDAPSETAARAIGYWVYAIEAATKRGASLPLSPSASVTAAQRIVAERIVDRRQMIAARIGTSA